MKTVLNDIKPDSVMWLGDNPSHTVWNQSSAHHLDGIYHISRVLQAGHYDSVGSVYPILGNHEGLPCDIFDFEGKTHDWVINGTAASWKPWFTPEAYQQYRHTGSYSQLHPGTKLRIIGLNDLVHDSVNTYLWKNATDPWGVVITFSHDYSWPGWSRH